MLCDKVERVPVVGDVVAHGVQRPASQERPAVGLGLLVLLLEVRRYRSDGTIYLGWNKKLSTWSETSLWSLIHSHGCSRTAYSLQAEQ